MGAVLGGLAYISMTVHSPFAPANPSFDLVSASIRLGHKYQMAKLVDHSIAYLKTWYPADLATWQKHCASGGTLYVPPGFHHSHAVGVVNLARFTGELSILPTALLDCCLLEEHILKGFDRADGTHEELTPADLQRCLSARVPLAAAGVSVFARAYHPDVSEGCADPESCRAAFHKALALIFNLALDLADSDPFEPLPRLDDKHQISLCSLCFYAAMARGREVQQGFWQNLAEIFDVEVDGWGAS